MWLQNQIGVPMLVIALSEYPSADQFSGGSCRSRWTRAQTAASLPCRQVASKVIAPMTAQLSLQGRIDTKKRANTAAAIFIETFNPESVVLQDGDSG